MNFKIADSKFKELLIPTLLIVMALNINAVVDSFFVGSYIGKTAVGAIQVLEPLILLITVFEWLFGLGGQILALNKKAEFDIDGSNRYFTVSMVISFIVSMIMAIICLLFMDSLVTMLHATPTTKPLAIQYAAYLFVCFVISTVVSVLTQYIRVDNQPIFASAVIILANVINMILDYVFLSLGMGMSSTSLASLIGYIVALVICLWYIRNPNRTFRFTRKALEIKTLFNTTWKMIKVGFPVASIGIFDVIFVYILNFFLVSTLGDTGLTTYTVCLDALIIASIINCGIAETLASIVPIYYAKHDYVNLNHLMKNSFLISIISAIIIAAWLWIWPQGFLALYNFNEVDIADFVINALKLYSIFIIVSVLPNMLIYYYEAIERSLFSSILSVFFTLIAPLTSILTLYYLIGSNGIWLGFTLGAILTMIMVIIGVKMILRKEPKYKGLFLIEKDLVDKTKNFVLTNNDLDARKECIGLLKNLNARDEFCDNVNKIFDVIFDTNDYNTYVEVLVIDYPDNIHVDIKYDGQKENFEQLKHNFPEGLFNYAEVLGFNTIEYLMDKN